jgi:O-6-methylguanine DNA methyltransferase
MKKLAEFPSLCVEIFMSEKGIQKVSLSAAQKKGLSLIFQGLKQPALEKEIIQWIEAYTQKKNHKPLPFTRPEKMGDFTWKVLQKLQQIPHGKTKSYLEIAKELKNPAAFRAVGNACRLNPFPLFIPCHRVLKSDGSLGGFAFGLDMKQMLLNFETNHL